MRLLALGVASFVLTVVLIPLVIRLARRFNFLDLPGPRKIHVEPVPYGGGIVLALAVLAAVVAGAYLTTTALLRWNLKDPEPPEIVAQNQYLAEAPAILVYGLASLVILLLGTVDDRRRLSARFKLGVQTIAALGVALGGKRLELFDTGPVVGTIVTVLWILAVTNAFNLLDHMDGLSSGVAAIAASAFLIVALQTDQSTIAMLLVPLIGACFGFLCFNFPRAKIFLGDAGSLFIGFWLACLTISFTFYREPYPNFTYFVPLAVLAVPLFDMAVVVFIRLLRRKPVFEGDTNHLAHRLTALGMTRRRAVLTVWALTLLTGISATLLYRVGPTGGVLILVQLLITFGIITLLESSGRAPSA